MLCKFVHIYIFEILSLKIAPKLLEHPKYNIKIKYLMRS